MREQEIVQSVKNGIFTKEQGLQLGDALAKSSDLSFSTNLMKAMYEIMLDDLDKSNPAIFAAAYNAARIIHASLKDKSPAFSDPNIITQQNAMLACLQSEKINQMPAIKAQNIKAYGAAALRELLEDTYAKHSTSLGQVAANNKQVTLASKDIKIDKDNPLISINTPNYSGLPRTSELPRMSNVDPKTLPVAEKVTTTPQPQVFEYQTIPDLNAQGPTSAKSEYATLALGPDPSQRPLPTEPAEPKFPTVQTIPTLGNASAQSTTTADTAVLGSPYAVRPLPATSENQYGTLPQPRSDAMAYFPLNGGSPEGQYGLTQEALEKGRQKQEEQLRRANYQPLAATQQVNTQATQQYGGVPQGASQYADAQNLIDQRNQAAQNNSQQQVNPMARPLPTPTQPTQPTQVAIDMPPSTAANTSTSTPAATQPGHVAININDAGSEDNTSSSERRITDQKYHLVLTDQILTAEIRQNDNLRAQRMIAGSLFANMGLPASEIDKLLDKAFVASLDSAEFKSLEGARLLKLREMIAEIYKGGTKDITTLNKEIKETANKLLTRIGAKKLNNEKYVADNFSDIDEIKKESLERANKMLSEALDKNGSKEWNDAVIDSITNEIDYPKMIRDKHSDLLKENSKEATFSSRMQMFGGAFGTGAAFYILAQLLFPPIVFVGALLLIFSFIGAVVTVLAEGLSKLLTGITKFVLGISKLVTGLVVGVIDLIRSAVVGIANQFITDPSKKFDYFTLTPAALKGLDKIQNSIFEENKPKFSERNPERFMANRDGLQGKLDSISVRAENPPAAKLTPKPAPTLTPITPVTLPPLNQSPPIPALVVPAAVSSSTAAIAAATDQNYGILPGQFAKSDAAKAAAAITAPQPSHLTPEQVVNAQTIAAAAEQKIKSEAELKNNPDAARKTELNRLIAQSEGMIQRAREQQNQPLVTVNTAPPQATTIQTQLNSPITVAPLSASPKAPEAQQSTTAVPTNTNETTSPRLIRKPPPIPGPKTPYGSMPNSGGDGLSRS